MEINSFSNRSLFLYTNLEFNPNLSIKVASVTVAVAVHLICLILRFVPSSGPLNKERPSCF